jgi:hypothetical protein
MNVLGGVLLYLGSLTMLLAAAAIAAGAFLFDPQGEPAASAVTGQAAPPPMLRNDGKSGQNAKEGVQDVAKLHPVAPSASSISVRPKVAERPQKIRPKQSAKRTIKARPTRQPPAYADYPYGAYGYAAPPQPPLYFPYRR